MYRTRVFIGNRGVGGPKYQYTPDYLLHFRNILCNRVITAWQNTLTWPYPKTYPSRGLTSGSAPWSLGRTEDAWGPRPNIGPFAQILGPSPHGAHRGCLCWDLDSVCWGGAGPSPIIIVDSGDPPLAVGPFTWSSLAVGTEGSAVDIGWSLLLLRALCQNMVVYSRVSLIRVGFSLRSNTSPPRDLFNLMSWSRSLFSRDGRTLPSITSWSDPRTLPSISRLIIQLCWFFSLYFRFHPAFSDVVKKKISEQGHVHYSNE